MKSNFEFLNKYWPALAQIADTAEKYLYSDPNACMYKLGMFSERLVQEIMVFEGIPDPVTDNTQAEMQTRFSSVQACRVCGCET